MSHVSADKANLINRLRRIRGQVEAVERAVDEGVECATVLQRATACRGALDSFIVELIEDHIREHVVDPRAAPDDPRAQAAEELVAVLHTYLK
jgi:DNA-binding FrmR family transcriptional regulator